MGRLSSRKFVIRMLDGKRAVMISDEPMTLDEAVRWAHGQFGAQRVEGVDHG